MVTGNAPQRDSPSTDTEDFMNPAEEVLQETQTQLTQIADAMEDATGVDRRQFVFMSLVAAAATTFGVDALRAQAVGGAAAPTPQQPAPAPIPLGNGEPPSMMFQGRQASWPRSR